MKKQIIISMLVLLLVGTIIAQVIITRDIDITLDTNSKNKLAEYDIETPETSELICDSKICEFTMKDGDYGLGTHQFNRTGLTNQQILDKQDEIIDEWLRSYAQVLEDRENVETKTKIGDRGDVILK